MRPSGLAGKIALVTGAAGGIGGAIVAALRAEGCRVAAIDAAPVPLAPANDLRIETVDVTRPDQVEAAIERVERDWGPIECGVNAAGILATGAVVDLPAETWRQIFAVNAEGVFNVSQALARRMVPRRRGAIVTVASNAGAVPRHGMAAYAASKAAASMFTRSLGLELAGDFIRCNVVAPGSTLTPMLRSMWTADDEAARVIAGAPEAFRTGIPLGKLAVPDDIADAVVFLLSDRAGHITMAELIVDGGASLQA